MVLSPDKRSLKKPLAVKMILVFVGIGAFASYYKFNLTVDMASSFLLMSCSLKLLEINTEKDSKLFIYIMLYLSAVSFLFEQGLIHTALQLVFIMACLYALLVLSVQDYRYSNMVLLRKQILPLLKMSLFAVPVVVICFLFFPRLAPLWTIPIKNQTAVSGLSDSMSPGEIAELAKSDKRAFRVKFGGQVPVAEYRYWRGIVLDVFDGQKWSQSRQGEVKSLLNRFDPTYFSTSVDGLYSVMLEPNQQRWAFALDGSTPASSNLESEDFGVYSLRSDAVQPTKYQMNYKNRVSESKVSHLPTMFKLTGKNRVLSNSSLDLQVPTSTNPETVSFIKNLVARNLPPIEILTFLMEKFSREEFFYTLKPDLMGRDFVDNFMFGSKKGFCAHYAGSLAFMLRLANIPARVVMGYQGGEYNSDSDYLILRQYDAHAWVEAKLPKYGWVRVDPTAMVSPERIVSGLEGAIGFENGFLEGDFVATAVRSVAMLKWLSMRVDELNYQWQSVVVNYHQDEQYSLIKSLFGEFSYYTLGVFFAYSFAVFLIFAVIYVWVSIGLKQYTYAEKKYILLLYMLSKIGFKRFDGETPREYSERIEKISNRHLAKFVKRRTVVFERDQYR